MRVRAFIVLGAAFALATVSVVLARAWIVEQTADNRAATPSASVPVTRIVVAAEPLPYGGKLQRPKLRLADWPTASVPQGAFTSLDDVVGTQGSETDDRLVLRSLARDEPVLKSKISGFGARASLSTLIAPGQRAATIRVNDINGVAGFVLPGDRVDVLLTRESGGGPGPRDLATDVLLQRMKVLGIDQDANAEREKPAVVRAVTLEVTQEEAQKLTLAQKLGTLSLALRHAGASDSQTPRTITVRDLPLALPAKIISEAGPPVPVIPLPKAMAPRDPPPPRAAPPPVSSVRIVRGLDVSVYEVAIEKPATGNTLPEENSHVAVHITRPNAREREIEDAQFAARFEKQHHALDGAQ
ncbi:MAG TPA: Flp pilus assembly protein CpaB [Kiloniellales bacterium]|jgi:pilus assembly protein CpaB